jgi:hypothetical protein
LLAEIRISRIDYERLLWRKPTPKSATPAAGYDPKLTI